MRISRNNEEKKQDHQDGKREHRDDKDLRYDQDVMVRTSLYSELVLMCNRLTLAFWLGLSQQER